MVTIDSSTFPVHVSPTCARWIKYLALSASANLLIASLIETGKASGGLSPLPALRIHFVAPVVLSKKQEPQQSSKQPLPTTTLSIMTKKPVEPVTSERARTVAATQPRKVPASRKKPALPFSEQVQTGRFKKQKALQEIPKVPVSVESVLSELGSQQPKSDNQPVTPRTAEKVAVLKQNPAGLPAQQTLSVRPQRQKALLTPAMPVLPDPDNDSGRITPPVIHAAKYRRQTPPVYPKRALELGQEGVVLLHAKVAPDGLPRVLKVARSSGHRLLDLAALAAVKKWEFEPGTVNGQVVTTWVQTPVHFVIKQ